MKVKELARAAGVTPETVRHYTRAGLLEPARDPDNGYRIFAAEDLARLRFVRAARRLGFTVDDVIEIVAHAARGSTPCPFVRERAQLRLEEVRHREEELESQRRRLEAVLGLWDELPDGIPEGRSVCPLIERAAELEAGEPPVI